jgi:hypothetical protein
MRWLKPLIFTLLSVLLLLQAGGLIQLYKTERAVWQYRMLASSHRPPAVSIVSITRNGDSINIVAIPDAGEDEIIERIGKAVHNSGKELPAHLFKLFDLYYLPTGKIILKHGYLETVTHSSMCYTKELQQPSPEITYPPEYC